MKEKILSWPDRILSRGAFAYGFEIAKLKSNLKGRSLLQVYVEKKGRELIYHRIFAGFGKLRSK